MSQRHLEPVLPVPDSSILNHLQVKYPDFSACVYAWVCVCVCVCERERERDRERETERRERERENPKKLKAVSQRSGKPASVS